MQKKCPHTNYDELREGQGGYDPNSTTFICLDCGHTWGYEIELEHNSPEDNF